MLLGRPAGRIKVKFLLEAADFEFFDPDELMLNPDKPTSVEMCKWSDRDPRDADRANPLSKTLIPAVGF